jgi:hypothetical protein
VHVSSNQKGATLMLTPCEGCAITQLHTDFSPGKPGVNNKVIHMGFVVGIVALRQVYLQVQSSIILSQPWSSDWASLLTHHLVRCRARKYTYLFMVLYTCYILLSSEYLFLNLNILSTYNFCCLLITSNILLIC